MMIFIMSSGESWIFFLGRPLSLLPSDWTDSALDSSKAERDNSWGWLSVESVKTPVEASM